jgi:hypothetical protein
VDVDFVDEHKKDSGLRNQDSESSDSRDLIPDSSLFYGDDADLPAVLAVVLEANLAVDLGEQGVVFSEPDIEPRLEATPLLPNEDRATGDEVAVVTLHAETLRVAVPTVA